MQRAPLCLSPAPKLHPYEERARVDGLVEPSILAADLLIQNEPNDNLTACCIRASQSHNRLRIDLVHVVHETE